ncbi:MAG: DUF2125 domain-containing protein, partial [Alphaproteobacteria bacterium]|nr:DUF2125 domain-containing protein [Alphaproteobacteria bacterium]
MKRTASAAFTAAGVIVLGVGAYSLAWYVQAVRARQAAEAFFAGANARGYAVSYQAIETSGFPFTVTIRIKQPHYKLRMDTLLKDLYARTGKTPADSPKTPLSADIGALPEWTEEGGVDALVYGVDLGSDRLFLRSEGNASGTSTIRGDTRMITAEMQSPTQCTVQMNHSEWRHGLWATGAAFASPQDFVRSFRALRCEAGSRTLKDAASGELLDSSDPATLALTSIPSGALRTTRFELHAPKSSFTPGFDAYAARYTALFPRAASGRGNYHFSAYGERSIDLALSLAHPAEASQWTRLSPLTFTVERFTFKNALYAQTLDMLVDYRPQEHGHVAVKMNAEATFSPGFDAIFSEEFLSNLTAAKDARNPKAAALQQALASYSDEQLKEMLKPALFNLHEFSPVALHVDAAGDQAANAKPAIEVSRLDIFTAPYGLSMKGAYHGGGGSRFTLSCRNLLPLVEDMFNYAVRLRSVALKLSPQTAAALPPPTPALLQGIEAFLTAIADRQKDTSGDELMVFAYQADAGGLPSVNGKTMEQLF